MIECRSRVWFDLSVTAAESFTVKKILECNEIKSVRSVSVALRVKNKDFGRLVLIKPAYVASHETVNHGTLIWS